MSTAIDPRKVLAVNLHLARDVFDIGEPAEAQCRAFAAWLEKAEPDDVQSRRFADAILHGIPAVAVALPPVGATIRGSEARGFPVGSVVRRVGVNMPESTTFRELRAHGWMPCLRADAHYTVESYPTEMSAQRTV